MTPEQMLIMLPITLRKAAGRYFHHHVHNQVENYAAACAMMAEKFNGPAQQRRAKNALNTLRYGSFRRQGQGEAQALIILNQEIERLFPQVPQTYQVEDNRVDALKRAILGCPWASTAIERLDTEGLDYEMFYSTLTSALQRHIEEQTARGVTGQPSDATQNHPIPPVVHFLSRRRVRPDNGPPSGRPNNPTPTGVIRFPFNRRPFFKNDESRRCWNCQKVGHLARDCKDHRRPWDAKRVAAHLIRDTNRKADLPEDSVHGYKRVLHALCEETNDVCVMVCQLDDNDHDHSDDDAVAAILGTGEDEDPPADNSDGVALEAGAHDLPREHFTVEEPRDYVVFEEPDSHEAKTISADDLHVGDLPYDCRFVDIHRLNGPASEPINFETLHAAPAHNRNTERFEGACLDTGATRTIIGLSQAIALRRALAHRLEVRPSTVRVRFGSGASHSRGIITIPVQLGTRTIFVNADIVDNDVPLLIGLDTFDRHRLTPDVVDSVLIHKPSHTRYQCVRKLGHLYFVWHIHPHNGLALAASSAPVVLYSARELSKLHKHFSIRPRADSTTF